MSTLPTANNTTLRKLLAATVPADSDFQALCVDYFPQTAQQFGSGMDRTQRETILLQREDAGAIVAALKRHQPERFAGERQLLEGIDLGSAPAATAWGDPQASAGPAAEEGGFSLLKNPGRRFVGRKEQRKKLASALRDSTTRIAVLTGLGGIGKSSLLYQVWLDCKAQFKASLCLCCSESSDAEQVLLEINRWLVRLDNFILDRALRDLQLSVSARLPVLVQALESGGPYLLGLDSFEAVLNKRDDQPVPRDECMGQLLSLLSRGLRRSKVLVASRVRPVFDAVPDSVVWVPLSGLSQAEAMRLMQSLPRLRSHAGRRDFETLWKQGAHSPLFIERFEAALQDYDLHHLMTQGQRRLHGELFETQQLDLLNQRLSAEAQALLRRAAVYEDPVILEILVAQLPAGTPDAHAPLKALLDRSLLDAIDVQVSGRSRKHYRMHESTRTWAAQLLLQTEGQAGLTAARRRAGYAYLGQLGDIPAQQVSSYAVSGWSLFKLAGDARTAGILALEMCPLVARQIHPNFAQSLIQDTLASLGSDSAQPELEAACHVVLSTFLLPKGQLGLARSRCERALQLGRTHGNLALQSSSLRSLAAIAQAENQSALALQLAVQSLELAVEAGNRRLQSYSHAALAKLHLAALQLPSAFLHCFNALSLLEAPRLPKESAPGATAPAQPGETADPEPQSLRQALELFQTLNDFFGIVELGAQAAELVLICYPHSAEPQLLHALFEFLAPMFQAILTMSKQLADTVALSQLLGVQALFELRSGRKTQFGDLLRQSIEFDQKLDNLRGVANKTFLLAVRAHDDGEYEQAASGYEQYLELEKQLGGDGSLAAIFCHVRMAQLHYLRGKPDVAHEQVKLGLAKCQQLPPPPSDLQRALQLSMLKRRSELEAELGQSDAAQKTQSEWRQLGEQLALHAESNGGQAFADAVRKQLRDSSPG